MSMGRKYGRNDVEAKTYCWQLKGYKTLFFWQPKQGELAMGSPVHVLWQQSQGRQGIYAGS